MRPEAMKPRVTAGLTWQPEIGPMAYTRATSTNPKARAVATTPAAMLPLSPVPVARLNVPPKSLKPKDSVATPTAMTTNISVPMNSAASFLASNMAVTSCVQAREWTQEASQRQTAETWIHGGALVPAH